MLDGITVTVAVNLKPEFADSFFDEWLPELQKETALFEGVRSVRALRQLAEPTKVMFVDIFDSLESAQKYFAWRESSGALKQLGELLVGPPQVEFWPISREPS